MVLQQRGRDDHENLRCVKHPHLAPKIPMSLETSSCAQTEPPKNTKTKSEKHPKFSCVMYTLTKTSNNKPSQEQRSTTMTTTTTTTTMHPKHRPRCSLCARSNRRFGGRRGFCLLLILLLLSLMRRWRLRNRSRSRNRIHGRSRSRIHGRNRNRSRSHTRHTRKQDRTSYDAQQAF